MEQKKNSSNFENTATVNEGDGSNKKNEDGVKVDVKERLEQAAVPKTRKICTCGRTKTPPYCDKASHDNIDEVCERLKTKSDINQEEGDFGF
jgi:CDGSH-type Zn-finger protein